jgi:hypothetical protein
VVRLAEALELSLRQRNDLLLAAGFAPVYGDANLDDASLAPVREALDRILEGHLPYPTVVLRPYGELITANAAFDVLTAGVAPFLPEPPVNVLRLALHPDGVAGRVANLPEWAGTSWRISAARPAAVPTTAWTPSWPSWPTTSRRSPPAPTTSASPCPSASGSTATSSTSSPP